MCLWTRVANIWRTVMAQFPNTKIVISYGHKSRNTERVGLRTSDNKQATITRKTQLVFILFLTSSIHFSIEFPLNNSKRISFQSIYKIFWYFTELSETVFQMIWKIGFPLTERKEFLPQESLVFEDK